MSEFYHLNPKLIMRYQPFLAKQRERLAEDSHYDGWVFGQYVSASIGASFSRHKYPKKPLYEMSIEPDEPDVAPLTDADRFMMWAVAFNAEHKDLPIKKDLTIIDASDSDIKEVDISNQDSNVLSDD